MKISGDSAADFLRGSRNCSARLYPVKTETVRYPGRNAGRRKTPALSETICILRIISNPVRRNIPDGGSGRLGAAEKLSIEHILQRNHRCSCSGQ